MVTASNGDGTSATQSFNITVQQAPSITSGPPTSTATVGTAYSFSYTAGGYPAPTFSVTSGSLPTNLALSSTGTISGTPTAAGTFNGIVTAGNGVGTAATQSFSIVVSNTFNSWASQQFTAPELSNPAVSGPTATPENDGVANASKYYFDIAPMQVMSATDRAALPTPGATTSSGNSYLTLTYRQNPTATGVTVSVQTSSDLQTWQTVTPSSTQTVGTDAATGDPITEVMVNVTGSTRKFIQLNVTSP